MKLVMAAVVVLCIGAQALPAQQRAAATDAEAPLVYLSPRYRATLEAVRSGDARDAALREALESCPDLPRLPDDLAARVSHIRGAAPLQTREDASGQIVLSVTPAPNGSVACTSASATGWFTSQGVQVQWEPVSSPSNTVGTVTVKLGERELSAAATAQRPLVVFSADGSIGTDGLSAMQLLLSFDALIAAGAPRAPLHIDIASQEGSEVTRITVPARVITSLLESLLPGRVASANGSGGAGLVPRLPAPAAAQLAEVHAAYAADRHQDAALAALTSLADAGIARSDRTNLYAHVGASLAVLGDANASRVAFARALDLEPCLQLADADGSALAALLDAVRPPMRCTPVATRSLVIAGLIPGGAQRARSLTGRSANRYVAALVAGAAVGSFAMHATADRRYDEYLNNVSNPPNRYDKAQSARDAANALGIATWTVWGGAIVVAVIQEQRYRSRLATITRFGADDRRALRIEPATRGLGLALHLF